MRATIPPIRRRYLNTKLEEMHKELGDVKAEGERIHTRFEQEELMERNPSESQVRFGADGNLMLINRGLCRRCRSITGDKFKSMSQLPSKPSSSASSIVGFLCL